MLLVTAAALAVLLPGTSPNVGESWTAFKSQARRWLQTQFAPERVGGANATQTGSQDLLDEQAEVRERLRHLPTYCICDG
jgi:hypothetical protein